MSSTATATTATEVIGQTLIAMIDVPAEQAPKPARRTRATTKVATPEVAAVEIVEATTPVAVATPVKSKETQEEYFFRVRGLCVGMIAHPLLPQAFAVKAQEDLAYIQEGVRSQALTFEDRSQGGQKIPGAASKVNALRQSLGVELDYQKYLRAAAHEHGVAATGEIRQQLNEAINSLIGEAEFLRPAEQLRLAGLAKQLGLTCEDLIPHIGEDALAEVSATALPFGGIDLAVDKLQKAVDLERKFQATPLPKSGSGKQRRRNKRAK